MAAPIDHAAVLLAAVLTLLAGPALASAAGFGPGPESGALPSDMRDNLINDNTPVTRAQMAAYSDDLQAVADRFEVAKREYLQGECSMFEAATDSYAAVPDAAMDAAEPPMDAAEPPMDEPSDPGSVNTIPAEPAASPACVAFSSQDFDATCQDPLLNSSVIHGVCARNSGEMAGMGVNAGNGVLFATAAMSGEAVAPFFGNEFAVNYLNTCEDDDMGSVRCGTASVSADLEDVVVYGLRNQGRFVMDFTEPTNALSRMTVLVGTVQEQSALTGTDHPELTVNGGVLACVDTHNDGRFTASNMEKLSVKDLANFERFTVDDSTVVVMTDVTNDGTIKISPNTASVAVTTNRGDFAATVQDSAHFADFVNANGGHLTLSEASPKGSTFSIDTITNAGEVQVTGGALTACGVTNSAGGSMAVLDTAIGTMHILENSGDLNFTGSYGNVVLVDGATRGSVTGDANINWVLNGQDCDVGESFAPIPSPPTNQYTWSRAPTAYVLDLGDGDLGPSTGKSRDDESSSTGYVVAIVLATVAALGLMAVVIRRQAQQSTTPRGKKSARVSPASMDGIILTSMDHVAAVEDAKTAASAKRATVRVTAIAAAALSSPEDKPVAAAPSSLAPAGDRMSTRRSSEVITLAVTPVSSPMVSRRTRRMSEDIIMLAPSPAASPKLLRGNKAGSISTATNKPTTRSSTRLVTATTR